MDSKSHVSTNTTTPQITPVGQQGTNNSPGGNRSSQPTHTRTYQACIPCRRRKVRCDLGPVDNPHDPPCVRCRRESKECYFSATRRKRRPQDGGEGADDGELSDYEIRNGRKRLRSGPPTAEEHHRPDSLPVPLDRNNSSAPVGGIPQPLTPGGSVGRYQPLRRPTQNPSNTNDEEDQKVSNETAAVLQTREVYSGHDALNLLFEAAGRSGDIEQHHRSGSNGSAQRPVTASGNTPGSSHASYNSTQANGTRFDGRNGTQPGQNGTVDTGITFTNGEMQTEEQSLQLAANAWARFRFVRAGWFTAKEAMAYLDYFYQYLSPLTPIVVPDYRHPSKHPALLTDEPMLVVTLLTIASRYMKLAGPGASSRPYAIHEKLWTYLQGMIDRMIWGQEQHGSQFMGAGAEPGCDVNPLTRKGLRTLGTVESLMLLTEWHPRALHFPPGDDGDELMAPEDRSGSNGNDSELYNGVGGARIDSWLEPCWRSDRMCWMLLGNAMSLGYEIGIFDETTEAEFQQDNPTLPKDKVHAYFRRKIHLKKLLVIYVTQTSGRLGLTSMLPRAHRAVSSPNTWDHDIQQGMGNLLRSPLLRDDDPMRSRESLTLQILHNTQDMVLDFWKQVAGMMEQGNQTLFPSRRQTRELIKSGKYIECLQGFQPKLQNFKRTYEKAIAIPTHMRHILTIEFEYTRVYLNSLALQAVVERCTHNTPMQAHAQPPTSAPPSNSSKSDGGAIPFSTLAKWYGGDRYYIREVIDACRSVLRTVVEGLYPGDYLKHAPVRTWFRIISVAMILLKTFALGATEDDVAISLGLMDKAVEALRVCIVDDVHVGNRFADLLETLTSRIRSRFVRMATNGTSRAASGSPAPQTGQQTPVMPPPPQPGHHFWSGFGSNGLPSPSLGATAGGRQTPNHPLWGISTETYDPNANNISIMPPPTFGPYDHHANNANHNTHYDNTNVKHFPGVNQIDDAQTNGNGGYQSDWLALPLDPLINNYGADVTASSYGPDVGGYDLLDVLLEGMGGTA